MDDKRTCYDAKSLAERLKCSSRHIWRMEDEGLLPPAIRLGQVVRWDVETIERWIAAGCPAPAAKQETKP